MYTVSFVENSYENRLYVEQCRITMHKQCLICFPEYYVHISVEYGSLSLFTLNQHSFSYCTAVLETL
jgi:hypothetical protein